MRSLQRSKEEKAKSRFALHATDLALSALRKTPVSGCQITKLWTPSFWFLGLSNSACTGDNKGRVRGFPHVDGNYATHVYLEGE
jgi:hypothetical protein